MAFTALKTSLARLKRRLPPRGPLVIEVAGGLSSSRRAFVRGSVFVPEESEDREAFEARTVALAGEKGERVVVLGGLPPLPGTDALAPGSKSRPAGDYWDGLGPKPEPKREPGPPEPEAG